MIIRTIACGMDNCGIWISDKLWHEPKHAIRAGKLEFLGFYGWYSDENHKKLYKILDDKFQISKMWPGEYMEVEFEIDDDLL